MAPLASYLLPASSTCPRTMRILLSRRSSRISASRFVVSLDPSWHTRQALPPQLMFFLVSRIANCKSCALFRTLTSSISSHSSILMATRRVYPRHYSNRRLLTTASRRMKSTSISCWNTYPRPYIEPAGTTSNSSSPCQLSKSSSTCTNCSVL